MDKIEVFAKAMCFEYYVGYMQNIDSSKITKEDAVIFYNAHKEEYLHKAQELFEFIEPNVVIH